MELLMTQNVHNLILTKSSVFWYSHTATRARTHTQTLARKARDAFLIIKISNIKPTFNFFKSQITQALEDER